MESKWNEGRFRHGFGLVKVGTRATMLARTSGHNAENQNAEKLLQRGLTSRREDHASTFGTTAATRLTLSPHPQAPFWFGLLNTNWLASFVVR